MRAIYFPKIDVTNPLNGVYNTLYIPEIMEEIYIKRVYQPIFEGRNDMVVLDLGANCGLATQYFREFAKKVYSFEPDPQYFEALSKNKEINEWSNVEIFNKAVALDDGKAQFHICKGNRTASSLDNPFYVGMVACHEYEKGFNVETVALDTFVKEKGIGSIDFMKMDIEGQESSILQSAGFKEIAPIIKAIMIEFHNGDNETLVPFMESLGFNSKRYETDTCNYLFYRGKDFYGA